jgi:hypothetical protein
VPIPPVEIADDDFLYRRLAPDHMNPDGTVNSNAFKRNGHPDPEPSVELERLTSAAEALARAPSPQFRLGRLRAGDVRALGLAVSHAPTEDNPAHSLIRGNNRKATCRQLAEITHPL